MNRFTRLTLLFFMLSASLWAQKKVTVEEIYRGQFRPKGMDELQSLKNSDQYTVLNFDRSSESASVDLFDFGTLKKVSTLIDSKGFPELKGGIDSYGFDPMEKRLLLAVNTQPIFRHSFTADFYLYDIATKQLKKLFEGVQQPTFSPDGTKIAYAKDNNLFVYEISSGASRAVTSDGKKNSIINGITDWVYEEEFAFVRAFDWSADSKRLAYIRFDETQVPQFSMDIYEKNLYPQVETFKYPKAGEKNSLVSLHLYDLASATNTTVALPGYSDFYIPRLQWTKDANQLSVQVINRHQDKLDLLLVDAATVKSKILLQETDKAYVDVTDNLTFLNDNSFLWTSEKDGYNHIYYYDKTGKLQNQVTKGNWEVTAFYGFDARSGKIFYQSVEGSSIRRDIYSIGLNGKGKKKLSEKAGTNVALFSPKYDYFINTFSNSATPPVYTLNESATGKVLQTIVENAALLEKVKPYDLPAKEFLTITTAKGHQLNAWIIKPKDFDPSKKYPVFMFQYSGPGSQQVADDWFDYNDWWFLSLTQQGYIVACVDGRGTGYKGADFKKVTQLQLGKYEVEDQIDAARVFGAYPYVDPARIGIFGWSFGGFMASNCILKGGDVFKMAIAVAPVTNWRFYDSIYTERYLQTPQENASGYDDNSPINFAKNLQGKFLLIHGSADDNVHVQNSMQMIEALVQANKNFDWAIYPDKNHGIYGGMTRIQLFNKMTDFVLKNL